ncbi:MAG TPA: hypothetical protein VGQ76_21300 [Thermoanaerobaculia bacterium]|jgi:hypothetical protein|nr:hypothetical protein [Thermoanaerobaculia bacterium]
MRKSLLAVTILSLACAMSLVAQAPPAEAPACPSISAFSPDVVNAGDPITVTASVNDGDPEVTPTYNWSVSDGIIESGQGTSVITIDTKEATSGFITATVEVGGYSRECATTQSSSTTVQTPEPAEDEEPTEEKPPR